MDEYEMQCFWQPKIEVIFDFNLMKMTKEQEQKWIELFKSAHKPVLINFTNGKD